MTEPGFLRDFIEKKRAEHAAGVKAHEELIASEPYQSELKFIGRMSRDVLQFLNVCMLYSSRAVRNAIIAAESIIACILRFVHV